MATEIRVPTLGESITEATVAQWFKKPGEAVSVDEPLLELETDKVTVEIMAPAAGVLADITASDGETVEVGALLGQIGADSQSSSTPEPDTAPSRSEAPAPQAEPVSSPARQDETTPDSGDDPATLSPAVRKLLDEHELDPATITGTGKAGRIVKADIMTALQSRVATTPAAAPATPAADAPAASTPQNSPDIREERVRMTRLRKTIATRLKESQNTAAMLTTFNEVDMSNVMETRNHYKDLFEKKHGVRLGFMGFFVRACTAALREIPAINAEIQGDDLVYRNYYNIGVAVGTDKGLVVPVLKNAQDMSLSDIEKTIGEYGGLARDGKLTLEDLQGGTFTISNGGVYGSLMSTPILNMPQSGILGMHKIQERPVVVNGEITIRPMMYLALSYDHRIVDGKEAVTFLVRVKETLEDPKRLLLDI